MVKENGLCKHAFTQLTLASNGPDLPPDAFEVALLAQESGTPLVAASANLSNSDAFLNVQSDGRVFAGRGVVVEGTFLAEGRLDLSQPFTVTVDLAGLPPDVAATLSFDLVGFGSLGSSAQVEVPPIVPVITPLGRIDGQVYATWI